MLFGLQPMHLRCFQPTFSVWLWKCGSGDKFRFICLECEWITVSTPLKCWRVANNTAQGQCVGGIECEEGGTQNGTKKETGIHCWALAGLGGWSRWYKWWSQSGLVTGPLLFVSLWKLKSISTVLWSFPAFKSVYSIPCSPSYMTQIRD